MEPCAFETILDVEIETSPLLILFIGIPASGKSTFYHRVFGEDVTWLASRLRGE